MVRHSPARFRSVSPYTLSMSVCGDGVRTETLAKSLGTPVSRRITLLCHRRSAMVLLAISLIVSCSWRGLAQQDTGPKREAPAPLPNGVATGVVIGTVLDPSGAAVQGATVTLMSTAPP